MTVLGVAGAKFTINGVPTFLRGTSYFDVLFWHEGDLDYFVSKKINLLRLRMDAPTTWVGHDPAPGAVGHSALNASGNWVSDAARDTIVACVDACAARRIVCDVVVCNGGFGIGFPINNTATPRRQALMTVLATLGRKPNCFFNLANEHTNSTNTDETYESWGLRELMASLAPGRLWYFGDVFHHVIQKGTWTVNATQRANIVRHYQTWGEPIVSANWADAAMDGWELGMKAWHDGLRAELRAIGKELPILLDEPPWGDLPAPYADAVTTAEDWIKSIVDAKAAGFAGYTIDINAGVWLATRTFAVGVSDKARAVIDATVGLGYSLPIGDKMPTNGPLTPHPANGRYLRDASGSPIFLVGPNTYYVNLDQGPTYPPPPFDWPTFLAGLISEGHNFLKFWVEDTAKRSVTPALFYLPPIFTRPGPGTANDGLPKFNTKIVNPDYLARIRARVLDCQAAGIYVSVQLFNALSWAVSTSWTNHPFNAANNVDGINGDPGGNGSGTEVFEGAVAAVTADHDAYIQAVVAAVGDLDNVIWEPWNEPPTVAVSAAAMAATRAYAARMLGIIRAAEVANGFVAKPILASAFHPDASNSNALLFAMDAPIIAPKTQTTERYGPISTGDTTIDPPAADGARVVSFDSDHNYAGQFTTDGPLAREMFWKNALRGAGILSLLTNAVDREMTNTRQVLKAIRETMEALPDLVAMTPQNALASSGYCLAHAAPGGAYLIYLPTGGDVTVDLTDTPKMLTADWINPATGGVTPGSDIEGGGSALLSSPLGAGDAVLRLLSQEVDMLGTWTLTLQAERVAVADAYRFFLAGEALEGDVPQTAEGVKPTKEHVLVGRESEIHNLPLHVAAILNGVLSRRTGENVSLSVESAVAPAHPAAVRLLSASFEPDEV